MLCPTSYILLNDPLLLVADNAGVIVNNKGEMKGKISDMAISLLLMRSIYL